MYLPINCKTNSYQVCNGNGKKNDKYEGGEGYDNHDNKDVDNRIENEKMYMYKKCLNVNPKLQDSYLL